jgi:hypothetical protein
MRNHNKRWLISRMKTAGSRRTHIINGKYSDEARVKDFSADDLPFHESIKKSWPNFANGKINTNNVARYLRANVGKNWEEVYMEITARIPKQLKHFDNVVLWYVADKAEFHDANLWCRESQKYLVVNGRYGHRTTTLEFYVDPESKTLQRIGDLIKPLP